MAAYTTVKVDHIPVRRAAVLFGVPETTLRERVNGTVPITSSRSGPRPLFTLEEETKLCDHLEFMASIGYGYSRAEVIDLASDYAVSLKKMSGDNKLGRKWFYQFLDRNPQLHVIKPRALEMARAKAASEEKINKYFEELHKILDKYDLLNKPEHIVNIDEKGICPQHKPLKVVSNKSQKPLSVTSPRSNIITLIGGANALGTVIPPYFVFPGKRFNSDLMSGTSAGSHGTCSPTGWSNTVIFEDYIKRHLPQFLQGRQDNTQHTLVLYDGHASHISLSLIEWARENKIILFVLPPHTTHVLQPLDVGCFGPFEVSYNSACQTFLRRNKGRTVTSYDIGQLACSAYQNSLTPKNVSAAFKATGIFPFNPDAIDKTKLAPSKVLKTTQPEQPEEECPSQLAEPSNVPATAPAQVDFLEEKTTDMLKTIPPRKTYKTLSKVTGGRAITEDEVRQDIQAHEESRSKKTGKRKCTSQDVNEPEAKTQKAKRMTKKTQGTTTKKTQKTETTTKKTQKTKKRSPAPPLEAIPGPSTYHVSSDDSVSDQEDVDESDLCCVCKKWTPDPVREAVSIIFTKWGQCECGHWTHLQYCTPVRVLRLHDTFLCPHCSGPNEE